MLLTYLSEGRFELLANVALLLEYEAVLKRPAHLRAANLHLRDVDLFIDRLAFQASFVISYFVWRPQLQDVTDEHVLEVAINGQANAIVTHNTKHFQPAAKQFGIEIMKPREALQKVRRYG